MLSFIIGASALLAGQAAGACTRELLGDVATKFIASAKVDGNTFKAATGLKYSENYKDANIASGVYSKAINVNYTSTLLDATACGVYVEIIAPDNKPGYQLATQIFVNADGAANKVEVVVTSDDPSWPSWFYNGKRALEIALKDQQSGLRKELPEAQRPSREHLKSVADGYFTIFGGKDKKIPNFSKGCLRQEGGFPKQLDCTLGVPKASQAKGSLPSCGTTTASTPHPDIRGYIIDETVGTVEVFSKFQGAPDSHDFRVENCEVVAVHAVTTTLGGKSGSGSKFGGGGKSGNGAKMGGGA
ncbi:hypothetical protein BT63DRAFT_461817 [Microthyrium microscopicum]|uniref:DUF8021 domain-containing protein n=1 Tax=Microthyrium microscopicum TaxID=703497 RepID=A0A6A6UQY6_9PEZI|nr:hypothetical protein BT63DRAFT_461817 [Microthyrium microscopicum]